MDARTAASTSTPIAPNVKTAGTAPAQNAARTEGAAQAGGTAQAGGGSCHASVSRRAFLAAAGLAGLTGAAALTDAAAIGGTGVPGSALFSAVRPARALADDAGHWADTWFFDTLPGTWYVREGWLDHVVGAGIMGGTTYEDGARTGLFAPDDPVTRGQVATILYRIANPGSTDTTDPGAYAWDSSFWDVPGGQYYTAAIEWCRASGVVTGYRDPETGADLDAFGPDDLVTREQLATMAARYATLRGMDTSAFDSAAFESLPDKDFASGYAVDALGWCADQGILTGAVDAYGTAWLMPTGTATRAQVAKVVTVLTRDVLGEGPWPTSWGVIEPVGIEVPYVDQIAYGAWFGCEGAALYMALAGLGYLDGWTYPAFLDTMPITEDTNPHNGFVGSPYAETEDGIYQGIYPAPLAQWGAQFGPCEDISGASMWDLAMRLQQGQPVVVFVTVDFQEPVWAPYSFGWAVQNAHVMTLVGYNPDEKCFLVADPNQWGFYWVPWQTFAAAYEAQRFAVAVG